jgi:hypothetical protein
VSCEWHTIKKKCIKYLFRKKHMCTIGNTDQLRKDRYDEKSTNFQATKEDINLKGKLHL